MIKACLAVVFIFFYYNFVKRLMMHLAEVCVRRKMVVRGIPTQELVGVIELIFIVISHVVFCVILSSVLDVSLVGIFSLKDFTITSLCSGVLLGIGQLGFSTTLCFILIRILQTHFTKKVPSTKEAWLIQSRAGWLRHHFHTRKHLPWLIASMIICTQILAEETVFRGVIFNYIRPKSLWGAIAVSTLLFTWIQSFLMPSKVSKMFPMVGALVMGITNGVLYAKMANLIPLAIAHAVFFFLAVI